MAKEKSTQDKIYRFICKNPGKNTYVISKKMRMSGGRARHAIYRLRDYGLVKLKTIKKSPRIQKLCYPVDALSLLPKALKRKLKRSKKK